MRVLNLRLSKILWYSYMAVSYTHLDVYKRQVLLIQELCIVKRVFKLQGQSNICFHNDVAQIIFEI